MRGKLEIRPLKQEDIPQVKAFLPADAPEPNWLMCMVMEQNGQVKGVAGLENVWRLEPLYLKEPDSVALLTLGAWMEGWLTARGINAYEFFIGDDNKDFQNFVETRLSIEGGREKVGKWYFKKAGV